MVDRKERDKKENNGDGNKENKQINEYLEFIQEIKDFQNIHFPLNYMIYTLWIFANLIIRVIMFS